MIGVVLFSLWLIAGIGGYCFGWWWRGRHEARLDREALQRIIDDQRAIGRDIEITGPMKPQSAKAGKSLAVPDHREERQHKSEIQPVFQSAGLPLPPRKQWGDLPYEELSPMFLDQFLLRYFSELIRMPPAQVPRVSLYVPWDDFLICNPWAREMPVLFQQLTGYQLNEHQLNNAIAEYCTRLSKLQSPKLVHGSFEIRDVES